MAPHITNTMKTIPPSLYIPTSPSDFIGAAHNLARLLAAKADELNALGRGTAKILLVGPPGTGKTSLAEFFAHRLAGHPSQVESVNGRNAGIDVIRQWQDQMKYCPMWGKFSVRIVNELDTAPAAAQDLLLTFLDELPQNTAFIGTSNMDLTQLTPRFQTRMQQFKVIGPKDTEIAKFLRKWKIGDTAIKEIAFTCGGNVRAALLDAQSILDARAAA